MVRHLAASSEGVSSTSGVLLPQADSSILGEQACGRWLRTVLAAYMRGGCLVSAWASESEASDASWAI